MFQAEAAEIRANGGAIRRVQLDFEIKRDLNRDLSKAAEEGPEAFDQAQRQIAFRHGLRVVRGHVQVPDVRIEYESDQGVASRVSLELTTDHYKRAQISAKAQAGFRLYSLGGDSSGAGSPVRDEREITAGILLDLIDSDRLTILQRNGYTEREARFLCLVGDVGGYFLRRHFSQFLDTKRGRPEAALATKLLEKRHAKLYLGSGGIELYHLSRRWFYRAIGSPDCRNRRKRTASAIHTRLLALDFVLADSDRRHLLSDRDKTRYLVQEHAVPGYILPVIQRRWIDRFPICLDRERAATQPVVRFCYVDPQVYSEQRFRSFLDRHASLWERLGVFRVTYDRPTLERPSRKGDLRALHGHTVAAFGS